MVHRTKQHTCIAQLVLVPELRAIDAAFGRGFSVASEVLTSLRELDMWTGSSGYQARPWIGDFETVMAVNPSKRHWGEVIAMNEGK
jgi:hypothetical protein